MTKWMTVVVLVAVCGCTLSREMAEATADDNLTDENAAGAGGEAPIDALAIGGSVSTGEPEEVSVVDPLTQACNDLNQLFENFQDVTQVFTYYDEAYCRSPANLPPMELPTGEYGSYMLCQMLDNQASEECRANAVPLIECIAETNTEDPATDCADVWLGEACNPVPESVSEPLSEDGLAMKCLPVGIAQGSEYEPRIDTFVVDAPALETNRCADGHRYVVSCDVMSDCAMSCSCLVDGTEEKQITVTEMNYHDPTGAVIRACGWEP